jgi:hypothetical protein
MRYVGLPLALLWAGLAVTADDSGRPPGLIDRHLEAKWREARVAPSRLSDDAEFLRRVTLDVIGTIPGPEEAAAFLRDANPRKRDLKVVELLGRREYAHNWAEVWEDILIGYDAQTRRDSKGALYAWLRDHCFAPNMPFDQMAGYLIASRGINVEHGPVNFLMKHVGRGGGVVNATGKVSRVFLGTQIQCAQCHDHPFDKWTQEDFYGMVAFFARVQSKKVGAKDSKDNRFELVDSPKGEAGYGEGKARKTAAPVFLDGTTPAPGKERREEFARLLTRQDNLQFARAAVNRYWGHFFGRGIVHPIDDFSGRTKPSHPELLDELAREFVKQKYDIQWLIRTIVGSRAYQLSSRVAKGAPPEQYFAYAQTRALRPEQLLSALLRAISGEEPPAPSADPKAGAKAAQDKENLLSQFRRMFGDEESVDIAEFDGTIPQALLLMNGSAMNQRLTAKNNRLSAILQKAESPEQRLEQMFLTVLSRMPREREKAAYVPYLAAAGSKREPYEDVYWTLLNSSEFLFNH